ncbi:MAG: hypothetical protein ACKVOU_10530 [Cytophagales bacterium]
MENLNELVFVLNRNRIKNIDQWLPRDSKLRQLFDGIQNTQFLNDDQAATFIYNAQPGDKKYLMLKKNLKNKLLEMILHCDSSENISHVTEKFELKKKLAITEMLLMENVYHNAEKILAKTHLEAIKLNLTDIEIETVRQLRILNFIKGVPEETHKYDRELKKLIRKLDYEQKPQAKWELLMSKKKYILQITDEMAEEAKLYLAETELFAKEINSITIELYELKLNFFLAKYNRKYAKVKELLDEIERLIHKNPHLRSHFPHLEMEMELSRNLRNLGKIDEARATLQKSLEISDYKAFNKFEVQALHVDILFKSGNYELAHGIINEVRNAAQFEMLHPNDRAFWIVMEGYVYVYYSVAGRNDFQATFEVYKSKNIVQSLENECKSFTKDKIGYQLQFIILKMLLLIANGGYKFDWDANFINIYVQRHVKDSQEKRTIHFIKLFIKVAGLAMEGVDIDKIKRLHLKSEKQEEYAYDVCEVLPYQFIIKALLVWVNENVRGK